MPLSYRIDEDLHAVLTQASGVLTEDELIAHKLELAQDPAFEPGMVELSDVRRVRRVEVTSAGFRDFVKLDALHTDGDAIFKMAIVASDDVILGMARLYESLTEPENPLNIGVFRELREAREWLGLPAED